MTVQDPPDWAWRENKGASQSSLHLGLLYKHPASHPASSVVMHQAQAFLPDITGSQTHPANIQSSKGTEVVLPKITCYYNHEFSSHQPR